MRMELGNDYTQQPLAKGEDEREHLRKQGLITPAKGKGKKRPKTFKPGSVEGAPGAPGAIEQAREESPEAERRCDESRGADAPVNKGIDMTYEEALKKYPRGMVPRVD